MSTITFYVPSVVFCSINCMKIKTDILIFVVVVVFAGGSNSFLSLVLICYKNTLEYKNNYHNNDIHIFTSILTKYLHPF